MITKTSSKRIAFFIRRIFHSTSLGIGVVLPALCACTPASHGAVIVDNTADSVGGHTVANQGLVQDFTPTIGGQISSLTLSLYSTAGGSVGVYLYSGTPSGASPGTLIGELGTLSVGTGGVQLLTLSGASLTTENLAANTVYGIQITGTTSIGWDWTSSSATANGSSGSITGYAWGNSGGDYSKGVAYAELAVSVVSGSSHDGHVHGSRRAVYRRQPQAAPQGGQKKSQASIMLRTLKSKNGDKDFGITE